MFLSYFRANSKRCAVLIFSVAALAGNGCASNARRAQQDDLETVKKQFTELQAQVGAMGTRLDSLEGRLNTVAPVHPPKQASAPLTPQPAASSPLKPVGVTAHPSEGIGTPPEKIASVGDPEPGFVNDDAVQEFRKSMILFEAGRYGDASVGFASFLEKYPDHPFAGSAQFYVGKSYLGQKQYTQAYEELQRVLTTYDRSAHIAETLRDLAEAEEKLHKNADAARHRQLLSSLFPQSPAFANLGSTPKEAAPLQAAPEPSTSEGSSQVEEIAGPPTKLPKKESVTQRPPSSSSQLDEPPPPTAPVEKTAPAAPAVKPVPKPGDTYPATTEDKS